MTPVFKTFLATLVLALILCFMSQTVWAGDSFRLCMAEQNKKTFEYGCWTPAGVIEPKAWLKMIDKSCKHDRTEIIRDLKQQPVLFKIHCKEGE